MKVLAIDYDFFKYPDGIRTTQEFAKFLNDNYNSFIKFTQFDTENCVDPYFVDTEVKEVYLNIANINSFSEHDVTILTREEYDKRLAKVVKEKCKTCISYRENKENDNLIGHRCNISLDGECFFYEKKEEE